MAGFSGNDALLDIELPARFELGEIDQYISELKSFLTFPLVQSLILAHPNEVAIQGKFSSPCDNGNDGWWSWAAHLDTECREEVTSLLINSATEESIPGGMPNSSCLYEFRLKDVALARQSTPLLTQIPYSKHIPSPPPACPIHHYNHT